MELDERVSQVLALPGVVRRIFAAAVADHLARQIVDSLAPRGFDELTDRAVERLWRAAAEQAPDRGPLEASTRECLAWAPHTEDEPDHEEIIYGLLAMAAACRIAMGDDVERYVRGLIVHCETAVMSFAGADADDELSLWDLMNAEPDWDRNPAVVEERRYQTSLLRVLRSTDAPSVDRATLLNL